MKNSPSLKFETLYCPRCAAPMQRKASALSCVAGQMALSSALEAHLLLRFAAHVDSAAPAPAAGSGAWYCPACRTALDANMKCSTCGGTLRDLLFALVELHPHR